MPIHLHIVPGDEMPIYRQIMRQIIQAVAGGRIKPGEQLPSHRELAETLVISPLTVKKAYDELEKEGYVKLLQGQGTFLSADPIVPAGKRKLDRLRDTARRLVSEAYLGGLSLRELMDLLGEEEARLRTRRQARSREGEGK